MEPQSVSATGSRDGQPCPLGDSAYDEYEDMSNATVGTSSPLGRQEVPSPRSDAKSQPSAKMSLSLLSTDTRTVLDAPRQLILNSHNLNGFERVVENGGIQLRADVIPDNQYVNYTEDGAEAETERKTRGDAPDISVMTVAGRTQDGGDMGSDAADSNTYFSNASLHGAEASLEGNAWNIDRASVDAQAGSPSRHHVDPLSSANLDQHLHNLTAGPAPLYVENIVSSIPAAPQEGNESTMATVADGAEASVFVNASEADAMSNSGAISPSRRGAQMQSSVGEGMDDMWSNTSTRGRDYSNFVSNTADENPHALSKENLRQLRHQLESGETPLRPELLAGLGTMVRVMTQTNSNMYASTTVEPAVTEDRSKLLGVGLSVGSPLQSFGRRRSSTAIASPVATMKDGENSGMAAMSFHSTLVEVPATEGGDNGGADCGDYTIPAFAGSEPVDASNPDGDDEDVGNGDIADEEPEDACRDKSSSDDSREAQNESVFNMTEDDAVDDIRESVTMSRHMRELFKLVKDGQRDQLHLRQQVMEQRGVIERLQNTVKCLKAELTAMKGGNTAPPG